MMALIDEYEKELLEIAVFEDKTVQNYTSCILKFCEYAKGEFDLDPVKAKENHIQAWMSKLRASGKSPSRLQHHQSSLRLFFSLLKKRNLIRDNPARFLPPIRRVKSERNKPITKEVAYRLLRSIDKTTRLGLRDYMIISILWALGLRVSEATSLRVGDFEPDHEPEKKIGLLRIKGKNKKQRALFVVDKLYDEMIAYLARPGPAKKRTDPLFPTKQKAISKDRVGDMIKEYADRVHICQRITPHVLRHSFATEMYHQGVPLSAIQAMMGHESIEETSIYIHVSDQFKREALELILILKED